VLEELRTAMGREKEKAVHQAFDPAVDPPDAGAVEEAEEAQDSAREVLGALSARNANVDNETNVDSARGDADKRIKKGVSSGSQETSLCIFALR